MICFCLQDHLCSFAGCTKTFTRKFCSNRHLKSAYVITVDHISVKKFWCPFCSNVFRTNTELLSHCEKVHDDKLDMLSYYIGSSLPLCSHCEYLLYMFQDVKH